MFIIPFLNLINELSGKFDEYLIEPFALVMTCRVTVAGSERSTVQVWVTDTADCVSPLPTRGSKV